jgi:hypothetical protein
MTMRSCLTRIIASTALLALYIPASFAVDLTPYRMERAEEIDLARSAAPPSIASDAEVLVFAEHGYQSAVAGKNGFVCVVERSWGAGLNDPHFWNPKIRGPICFNAAGAKSALAAYLERTKWVLAGQSTEQMIHNQQSVTPRHALWVPAAGAMCYMLSKRGYLSDTDGHWHPHLMFFVASDPASWGANLPGSPIIAAKDPSDDTTTFMVPVARWSDGTEDGAAH